MTPRRSAWAPAAAAFLVLAAQLALVAACGTDAPFQDQWGAEGRDLYAAWRGGTLHLADIFRAHNEHRIAWTRALDLLLFAVNGQWDPLVQLVAGAALRATIAGGLVAWIVRTTVVGPKAAIGIAAAVVAAFLPHLAWHNALWGFQSQVYFSLLFSLATLALLNGREPSWRRQLAGLATGVAGLLAMSATALVPVALLLVVFLRACARRRFDWATLRQAWPALALLGVAVALRSNEPAHEALRASGRGEFLDAWGRLLSWPHGTGWPAALAMLAPWLGLVVVRVLARREVLPANEAVLGLGGWAVALTAAIAWTRGGGDELATGVPSRYVDFVVLLPIASAWSAVVWWREASAARRRVVRGALGAWAVFVLIGWLGLSAQMLRGIILPRARDREAPVRLLRTFQREGNPAVFAGQPRLLVPAPNLPSVREVLDDPKMQGALPPSLQPERPMGPLSRAARFALGRAEK